MELFQAINERRSVRRFQDKPISEDALTKILQSAIEAPSAGNLQSRKFYVVKNVAIRKEISKVSYNQTFIYKSPVAIVVCVDDNIKRKYSDRGSELYAILDCAASIQNMMLTAYSLGLASCWVGAFDEDRVTEILNLSDRFRPVAILPIGYADEKPEKPDHVTIDDACQFVD